MSEHCGYAVEDPDGEMQPCDRPATGWRWYQNVGEHEDMLNVACDWHANEGGRLIHELQADLADEKRRRAELRAGLEALDPEALADEMDSRWGTDHVHRLATRRVVEAARALLDTATEETP